MSKRTDRIAVYAQMQQRAKAEGTLTETLRLLCQRDLFYLLTRACGRADIDRDWLYDRCLEVQRNPDNMLDLWAREHYKSTIITFGKTIQDILNNPEITVGIFSHTKPIARAFLRQIKTELENNRKLQQLFPEILYADPRRESKNWSEDNGITVKRATNPKEATIEAHGLVDGQPTSKHYFLMVYDDVVTRESVTSPEMIRKTTESWELSLNLGSEGGKRRFIGTRYHFNDTWGTIIARGSAMPRVYPATGDGTVGGDPVLLSRESLAEKRRDMGPYTFACQMLQDPKADETQGFKPDWIKYWDAEKYNNLNIYILVDPANEKKKMSDYTSLFVVGFGEDKNIYVIDMVRDRLNLTERCTLLMEMHKKYRPLGVGYEQYGMQSDIQHIEYVQSLDNYRFNITPVAGKTAKNDRIRRLIPLFEAGRIYFPRYLLKKNYEGKHDDLTKIFIDEEYTPFPVMSHDDMLDCLARVEDPDLKTVIRIPVQKKHTEPKWKNRIRSMQQRSAMSA